MASPYASYPWIGAPTVFNGTDPDYGGDSATTNVNQWFSSGDVSYIIIASAMVLVMPAGLAFLYSGLARRKSALSMVFACMGAFSVITFQWYFWGYSLAFSPSATNGFIGDLQRFGLLRTLATPDAATPLIPSLLYAFYQMQFAATTAAITAGAVAERGRLLPMMVFIFLWATVVYAPLACWVWNPSGWAYKYGVMDYAGGGPVEINSGMAALAYSMVLGRRQERMMANFRPHNVSFIVLGTTLLWFGWLGFNGGSAFGANLRAVMACWNSNLAAMFAAMTWTIMDWRLARKWSMVGWCSGCISGLVAATPASGFITPWGSVVLGIVSGIVCNLGTKVKYWVRIDDSMDVFAEHAVGGMLGLVFNALFGADYIIGLDGVSTGLYPGGWLTGNYAALYVQVAYVVAVTAYSFVVSALLAWLINMVPGLHLRASEQAELVGMDDDQLGEFAYDYVEVRRDYLAWTPATATAAGGPEDSDAKHPAGPDDIPMSQRLGIPSHGAMLEGVRPGGPSSSSAGPASSASSRMGQAAAAGEESHAGEKHTGIGGDRHGVAAEDLEKARRNADDTV